MVLPVHIYGSKVLHQRTTDITETDFFSTESSFAGEIKTLISNMIDTMVGGEGVGLAANQVGSLRSVIVLNQAFLDEDGVILPSVLINPHIVEESEETIFSSEACLSFPHLSGAVERAENVMVEYRDETFELRSLRASGIASVILQHEIDHLRGMTLDLRIHGIEKQRLNVIMKRISRSKEKLDIGYPTIIKR